MSSPEPERERLFFALWPDPPVRDRLDALARHVVGRNGRRTATEKLHLTLAFLGDRSAEERDCMAAAAGQVRVAPFTLRLDRIGHWRRPRILWAGASVTPPELLDLSGALNAHLAPCGYQPEARPFQAHLTLARKAAQPVALTSVEPIEWPVRSFCLVRSVIASTGSSYEILRTWTLGPEPATGVPEA
ncbi:MAG: RNA 2',3'-cyclic phosphodiesterase [Gammaproteobacteria bacterium]|jgi:RNA 2',3'-cyclic 3'-phosphodiesterase